MEYARITLYILAFFVLIFIAIYSWLYRKEVKKTTGELRIPLPSISDKILLTITIASASLSILTLTFLAINIIKFFY